MTCPEVAVNPEFDRICQEIEDLERRWFEAHRTALSAHIELLATGGRGAAVPSEATARLVRAESDKATIIRRIEALEDTLLD